MNNVTTQSSTNGQTNTLWLTQVAALIAIEVIMSMTPLGYLTIGPIAISFLCIPIAVGALTVGTSCSTILGLVFGLTSFYKTLTASGAGLGVILLGINPFYSFLMAVVPRVLVGLFTGLLFQALKRIDRTGFLRYYITGLCCALFNTILYMSALLLLYGRTDYLQELMAGRNAFVFVCAFVGINAVVEMFACCIISGTLGKVLSKVLKK